MRLRQEGTQVAGLQKMPKSTNQIPPRQFVFDGDRNGRPIVSHRDEPKTGTSIVFPSVENKNSSEQNGAERAHDSDYGWQVRGYPETGQTPSVLQRFRVKVGDLNPVGEGA